MVTPTLKQELKYEGIIVNGILKDDASFSTSCNFPYGLK